MEGRERSRSKVWGTKQSKIRQKGTITKDTRPGMLVDDPKSAHVASKELRRAGLGAASATSEWGRAWEAGKRDSLVRMTLWGYRTFSRSCWKDLTGGLPARVPGGEMPKADVEGDDEERTCWEWENELVSGTGGELLLCGMGTAAVRDVGALGGCDWDVEVEVDVIASSWLSREGEKVSSTWEPTRRGV